MSTEQITTEGRIFVRKMILDIRARSRAGAGLLSPGALTWRAALDSFARRMSNAGSVVHAGKQFAAGRERLIRAQHEHRACLVNLCMSRKRSGMFQLLTHEVSKHPSTESGYDGIMICSHSCRLQRIGCVTVSGSRVAFVSWHALGRLYERSSVSAEDAWSVVGLLGIAGLLMRESNKHLNGSVNVAVEGDILCTGILRPLDGCRPFFDCLTVLPGDEPKYTNQFHQGKHVANAVMKYLRSDSADPRHYADKVPALPFNRNDYVTEQLKAKDSIKIGMEVL
jgi:hypothetical protein